MKPKPRKGMLVIRGQNMNRMAAAAQRAGNKEARLQYERQKRWEAEAEQRRAALEKCCTPEIVKHYKRITKKGY